MLRNPNVHRVFVRYLSNKSQFRKVDRCIQFWSRTRIQWQSTLPNITELILMVPMNEYEASIPKNGPSILACSTSTSTLAYVLKTWSTVLDYIQRVWQTLWEAFVVSTRTMEVAIRFSPLLILTPTAMMARNHLGLVYPSDFPWWYILKTLQVLGPAWQKLGQWAATRRDLFPIHVCERLGVLHDRGFSHSWEYTIDMLRQSFGDDFVHRGLSVHELIGCGSAAQVYRGSLRQSDGNIHRVAIKVLHPKFAILVERDLCLMKALANLLHSLPIGAIHVLNLPRVSENFSDILRNQADLRVEGNNLTRFRNNFYGPDGKHEASSTVIFPKPVTRWSAPQILVEDLVEGATPITEFLQDCSQEGLKIRQELAGPLLRSFLKMVFIDSWVHCDLHPGNIMVKTTEVNGELKRRIVFLDAGIATSLSPADQQNLIDLFRAVLLDNGYEAGKLMVLRAKSERCSQVEGGIDAFAQGVADLVSEFHDRRKAGLTLGAVHIGSLLHRVLDLCRIHGVEIDPSMASIVLSTLVLEGLGRSLNPDLNLIDFAIPFVLGRGKV